MVRDESALSYNERALLDGARAQWYLHLTPDERDAFDQAWDEADDKTFDRIAATGRQRAADDWWRGHEERSA